MINLFVVVAEVKDNIEINFLIQNGVGPEKKNLIINFCNFISRMCSFRFLKILNILLETRLERSRVFCSKIILHNCVSNKLLYYTEYCCCYNNIEYS